MTTFDLRIGYVSIDCPRLQVQVVPRSDVPMDSILMIVRRMGAPSDLATYVPINIAGNVLTFQLDALVFDNAFGRYQGALASNGVKYQQCEFEYTAQTQINPAQQLCTVEPYRRHHEFAKPNWSGTGIAGPGTFIGLKDTPKQYTGCAGYNVFVNEEETGLQFLPGGGSVGTLNGLVGDINLAAGNGVSIAENQQTGNITIGVSGNFGVSSVNALTGAVGITPGAGIEVSTSGNNVVITSTVTGTTVNGLSGSVVLVAGTGVGISISGQNVTLTNTATPTSVNSLTGAVTLAAGNNVTLGVSGNTITINASGGGSSGSVNNQTGTTYAPVLSDNGGLIIATNASAITVTISPDSTTDFPVLSQFLVQQGGAGAVTLAAGAGVTLQTPNGAATASEFDIRGALKVATNTWVVL
jgi:hypothetical protein